MRSHTRYTPFRLTSASETVWVNTCTQLTGSEWKWRIWSSIPLHYAADGVQAKPGQACPKRKRERMSGRGEMDELKKDGWGTGLWSLFLFVCLTCRNTCVSYFLMGSSVSCRVHRPHSIPSLILSPPSPQPAQLRLHLSPATEAPTPADPLPREKKQTQDRGGKKVTV